jgi:hypothetical protein
MSDDTTQTVEQAVPPQEAAEQAPDLTVQDLQAIKTIIDVSSQRGSFKPNEMMTVGQVYTKLEMFLNAVAAQQGTPEKGE